MQKTTLAKLEVLSRDLMRVVNEFNDILEEEGHLDAELNDEEEDCPSRAEMYLLEDMIRTMSSKVCKSFYSTADFSLAL